jgi:aryl-alcohol dehydrogenase-like predicted oxidoreductase
MEFRALGRTGVKVSKLCLGCWMFGDRASVEESTKIIKTALDAGVNFFDTSNVYGGAPGRSESIVGDALAAAGRRNEVVLATKVYWPVDPANPNGRGVSRRHIIEQCELSLRRLRTDHIDLYYMHRLDPDVPVDEPLRALDDLIRAGKVRYIGASTTAAWQFVEALWVSKELGLNRFIAETPPYNIVDRRIERELLPMAETFGVAVNVWAPIAGGLLSGLYRRGEPVPAASRYADPRIATAYSHRLSAGVFDVIDVLTPIAAGHGCSLAQLALAWVLQQRAITTAVTGPEKLSDLVENVAATEIALTAGEVEAIDRVAPQGGVLSAFYEPDANQFRMHPHRV